MRQGRHFQKDWNVFPERLLRPAVKSWLEPKIRRIQNLRINQGAKE